MKIKFAGKDEFEEAEFPEALCDSYAAGDVEAVGLFRDLSACEGRL